MISTNTGRSRIAMISRLEALTALAAAPPEGLTAKEVYFAARPPASEEERAVGGSSYAHRALMDLVAEGVAAKCGDERPQRFRAKAKTLTPSGEAGLAVREVSHGKDEPSLEQWLGTAIASGPPLTQALPVSVVGPSDRPRTARAPAADGSDRIANALLRKLQAPKPGSRAEIVKVQAAEGISWARAAGIDDLAIAAEIVAATGIDAKAGEIVHLVASMPGSSQQAAR